MQHILIVSRNRFCADTLATLLARDGVCVDVVSSDECIVEVCRKQSYRIVIFLDLAPYFTSMNIVGYLRRSVEHPPVIFVVSTSHSEADILNLLECGVSQYISLPLNIYRLREKIERELRGEASQC